MTEHRNGVIWVRGSELGRMFAARRICYLVGSYDGSGNYGDILQLHANIERLRTATDDVLAVPLVYWRYAGDHLALRDRHPELFDDSCFLYYVPDDELDDAADALSDRKMVPVGDPPQAYSQTLIYGGGFFNSWWTWGVHKLDLIDLLAHWRGDRPADSSSLAIVGQQVSSNFLAGDDANRFADLLKQAATIGVRDELSLENLQQWRQIEEIDNLFLSGDDATMPIVAAGSERQRNGYTDELLTRGPARPYVVNVHLSLEDYVTSAPHQMLKAYEAMLRNVRRVTGNALTINLLVAYDDSRISERQYVDQLKVSPALAGVKINVVSCIDELLHQFPRIGDAQLTVSCSYHVALTSLLLGIPTAFVYANGYYWHKAEGLKRSFQIPDALLLDARNGNGDVFTTGIERVLREPHYHALLSARAAQGAASTTLRNTATSVSLANFLTSNYITSQETRHHATAARLLDSMEQLSDLRLEYGSLLNTATRLSTLHASGARSGQHAANGYQQTVTEIRAAVGRLLPKEATALVVSKGDGELLKLDGRKGWHFPQTPSGVYAGHHPADSAAAINQLEELRSRGASYLVIPNTCFWWLDHYAGFSQHLDERYKRMWSDKHSIIFGLAGADDRVTREQPAASPAQKQRAPAAVAATSANGRHDQQRDPIVVFGPPRSGTTYLIEILNRHPQVYISTETRLFVWAHQTMNVETQEFYSCFKDRDRFVSHLRAAYPDLIRSFYRDLQPDARYWGDKNPHYASPDTAGCLPTILDLFPGARFINIIRDGRGTVASVLEQGWEDFETAHRWWSSYLDVGCSFGRSLPANQYFELRYEDLIKDDTAMARRLFDFLGIDIHPNVIKFCDAQQEKRSPINKPVRDLSGDLTHTNWSTLLTPGQQLHSLDLLGERLVHFGYETESSLAMLRDRLLNGQKPRGIRAIGDVVRDVLPLRRSDGNGLVRHG